jgi:hypothetical protein
MSLQIAAKHLASKGRGPDDTLVHMSRNEVKSLSDLAMAHGGRLTTNPETGLPEAGFLSSLLPVVAGAALNAAVPGLGAAMGGFAIPAIVGGASYLMNPNQGLMGGLMAGLGAYGGMSLGQGLQNIATSEAGATAANAATQAGEEYAKQAGEQEFIKQQAMQESAKQAALSSPTAQNLEAVTRYTPDTMNSAVRAAEQSARDYASNAYVPPPAPTGLSGMYEGAKSLVTDPTADKFKTLGGGSYMGLAKSGLSAAAPAIMDQPTLNLPNISTAQKQQVVPHYRYQPGVSTPTPAASPTGVEQTYFPGSSYVPLSSDEASKLYPGYPVASAAGGGMMNSEGGYQTDPNLMQVKTFDPVVRMATGGISDAHYNLGGYSDGGRLLRGPGDGVSDSIPAVIGKKQPARLADGEFVVPARIVSELGNGSTEAGARKLYAMMDRVQAARRNTVGKGKVARNSRADKYLPA